MQLLGSQFEGYAIAQFQLQVDVRGQAVYTQVGQRGGLGDDDFHLGIGAEGAAIDREVFSADISKLGISQGQDRCHTVVVAGVVGQRGAGVEVQDHALDAGQGRGTQVGGLFHVQGDVLAADAGAFNSGHTAGVVDTVDVATQNDSVVAATDIDVDKRGVAGVDFVINLATPITQVADATFAGHNHSVVASARGYGDVVGIDADDIVAVTGADVDHVQVTGTDGVGTGASNHGGRGLGAGIIVETAAVQLQVIVAITHGDVDVAGLDFEVVVAVHVDDSHALVTATAVDFAAGFVGFHHEAVIALRAQEGHLLGVFQAQVHTTGVAGGIDGDRGFIVEGLAQVTFDVQVTGAGDDHVVQLATQVGVAQVAVAVDFDVQGLGVVGHLQLRTAIFSIAHAQVVEHQADTVALQLAVVELDGLGEAAVQGGDGTVANAGKGQAAGRLLPIKTGVIAFSDGQGLDIHCAGQVQYGGLGALGASHIRVGGAVSAVSVDVGQVLDVHMLDVEQAQGLRKQALGVHLQGIHTEAGINVGLVQQFEATGDDGFIAGGGEAAFQGAAVVVGRSQDDGRGEVDLCARGGDELLQVDQDRLASLGIDHGGNVRTVSDPIQNGCAGGAINRHLAPDFFFHFVQTGRAVGIDQNVAEHVELLLGQTDLGVGQVFTVDVQHKLEVAGVIAFLEADDHAAIFINGDDILVGIRNNHTIANGAFALQRIQRTCSDNRLDHVGDVGSRVDEVVEAVNEGGTEVQLQHIFQGNAVAVGAIAPVGDLLDGGLETHNRRVDGQGAQVDFLQREIDRRAALLLVVSLDSRLVALELLGAGDVFTHEGVVAHEVDQVVDVGGVGQGQRLVGGELGQGNLVGQGILVALGAILDTGNELGQQAGAGFGGAGTFGHQVVVNANPEGQTFGVILDAAVQYVAVGLDEELFGAGIFPVQADEFRLRAAAKGSHQVGQWCAGIQLPNPEVETIGVSRAAIVGDVVLLDNLSVSHCADLTLRNNFRKNRQTGAPQKRRYGGPRHPNQF